MSSKKKPTSKSKKIRLGITIGDPSGIGPQVVLKALKNPSFNLEADIFIIADKWVLDKFSIAKSVFANRKYKVIDLNNVSHRNFSFGK